MQNILKYLLFGTVFILSVSFKLATPHAESSNVAFEPTTIPESLLSDTLKPKYIKIMGVGDIMLGTNYPSSSYLPPDDGKFLLAPVAAILKNCDLLFGNLEGAILSGEGTVKKCADPSICYAFKMPDHYVNHLIDAGFDVLSIANNHIGDFGSIGTENTKKVLEKAGIYYAGLLDVPATTFTKNGIKYGFTAFAPNNGTLSITDFTKARLIIESLNKTCDIVIVSFHGGAEGSSKRHITRETEIFLGENRGNPYQFARMAIDAGADVVFGHGPHVTRAIDLYKDRFIAYSLGNFATYARFNLKGPNGISPIIELDLNEDGSFVQGKIYATKQLGEGGPVPDADQTAISEIIELTKSDIPESELQIEKDGVFRKR